MPAKMAAILFLIKQGGAIGEKRERIALEMEGVLPSVPKARSARVRQIRNKLFFFNKIQYGRQNGGHLENICSHVATDPLWQFCSKLADVWSVDL